VAELTAPVAQPGIPSARGAIETLPERSASVRRSAARMPPLGRPTRPLAPPPLPPAGGPAHPSGQSRLGTDVATRRAFDVPLPEGVLQHATLLGLPHTLLI